MMQRWNRQISFLISDISKNKGQFVIGMMQIGIALWIFCYVLGLAFEAKNTMNKISDFDQKKEVYQLTDLSEEKQFEKMLNSREGLSGLKSFYRSIKELKDAETFTADSSFFTEVPESQAEKAGELFDMEDSEDGAIAKTLRVSPNFFEVFHVKGDYKEDKIKKVFAGAKSGAETPVILGSSFKEYYKIGDKFKDTDGKNYRIEGFLKKGESYIAPFENQYTTALDDYFLVPAVVDGSDPAELISYITGTYFATDDKGLMDRLIQKAAQLKLIPFEYEDFHTQIKACIQEIKNQIMTMSAVILLIMIFASIGMVNYFIRLINEKAEEFAVHMLCGARKTDLLFRIAAQIGVMLVCADLIVIWQYGFCLETILTILIGFLYGAAVMVYPAVTLNRHPIMNLIRSSRS